MELQEKVFRKFKEGYSMTQIAKAFGISFQTVKRYIRYYRKTTGGLLGDDVIWDDGTTLENDL